MDGYVIIGTDLNTDKFDIKIKDITNKIEIVDKEIETLEEGKSILEEKFNKAGESLQKFKDNTKESKMEIAELTKKINGWKQAINEGRSKEMTAGLLSNINSAQQNIDYLRQGIIINNVEIAKNREQQEAIGNQLDKQEIKIQKQIAKREELINKLEIEKQKQKEITDSLKRTSFLPNLNGIKGSIDKIGHSVNKVTNKVIRWGLAIFGIRSAYMLIRRAASELASRDEKLAKDIEYIRYALASMLEPIVKRIVEWIYKLLFYVNYLAQAWFGINLFAKASMNNFDKTNKKAKELKKTLASFDEMNIISDNTSQNENKTLPSYDLSKMQGEAPEWLEWIKDYGPELLALVAGLVGFLTALKLGLGGLKALGIGVMIGGIVWAIEGLLKYLENPTWKNFGQVIEGIGIAFLGLALVIGSPVLAIVGACILIFGIIVKYWDKIKAFLQKGIDWLKDKSDWIHEHLGDFVGDIYDLIVGGLQKLLDYFDRSMKRFKENFDSIISFVKNVFAGKWTEALKDIFNIFENIIKDMGELFRLTFQPILDILSTITGWIFPSTKNRKTSSGGFRAKGGIFYPSKLPKLAMGGIINQPGRGVPYNGAIIGERGAEAVLPLTDSQQMALLGETIGKYVNINATIPVYVGNRQIAREMRKINAEDDFAFNR